jgi:large subunit ribosomal protein L10
MNAFRAKKTEMVTELNEGIKKASVVLVAHNVGLNATATYDLRVKVRKSGANLRVIKNTLAELALAGTPFEQTSKLLKGPTMIAYSSDPVAIAKVLVDIAKSNEKLVVLGGVFGENLLDAKAVDTLSKLPSLDELRAKIIALIQTPATRIAGVLQAPAGQVARVIGAHARKAE